MKDNPKAWAATFIRKGHSVPEAKLAKAPVFAPEASACVQALARTLDDDRPRLRRLIAEYKASPMAPAKLPAGGGDGLWIKLGNPADRVWSVPFLEWALAQNGRTGGASAA